MHFMVLMSYKLAKICCEILDSKSFHFRQKLRLLWGHGSVPLVTPATVSQLDL